MAKFEAPSASETPQPREGQSSEAPKETLTTNGSLNQATKQRLEGIGGTLQSFREVLDLLAALLGKRGAKGKNRATVQSSNENVAASGQSGGNLFERAKNVLLGRTNEAVRQTLSPEQTKSRLGSLQVKGTKVEMDPAMRLDMASTDASDLRSWMTRMSMEGRASMEHRMFEFATRMERATIMLGQEFSQLPQWEKAQREGKITYTCDGIRVWAERRDSSGAVVESAFATGGQVLFLAGPRQEPRGTQANGESNPVSVRTASGMEVAWTTTARGNKFRSGDRYVYERNNGNVLFELGVNPPRSVTYTGEGSSRSVISRVNSPGSVIPMSTKIDTQFVNAQSQGTFLRMPDGNIVGPPKSFGSLTVLIRELAKLPMEDVTAYLSSTFPGQTEKPFDMHVQRPGAPSLLFRPGNDSLVDAIGSGRISCQQIAVLLARIAAMQGKKAVALEMYHNPNVSSTDPNSGHVACVYIDPPSGGPPCRTIVIDNQGVHDDQALVDGATALDAATKALQGTWTNHGTPLQETVGVFDDQQGGMLMGKETYETVARRMIG